MFNIILLILDITLFILSFVFIFFDLESYKENKVNGKKFPKRSNYGFLCALLALILAVIISLGY